MPKDIHIRMTPALSRWLSKQASQNQIPVSTQAKILLAQAMLHHNSKESEQGLTLRDDGHDAQ